MRLQTILFVRDLCWGFVATDAADGDELYRWISMGQRVYMECIGCRESQYQRGLVG